MIKAEVLIPKGIEVSHNKQTISIEWEDIGVKTFPLFGLRKNCPCVVCRGGHDKMNVFEPEAFKIKNPPYLEIEKLEPIGNHALQIFWNDKHNSGMYRWETLRDLSKHL